MITLVHASSTSNGFGIKVARVCAQILKVLDKVFACCNSLFPDLFTTHKFSSSILSRKEGVAWARTWDLAHGSRMLY